MSGVVRLGQLPIVQFIRSKAEILFSRKYLLLTNTSITMCLSATGDLLQQRYEIYSKRQKEWDPVRSKHICVSGMFVGPANHYWYIFLDWLLPGRTFRIVAKKLVLDQIIFSPVNISLFLTVVGRQEGMPWRAIGRDLREKGVQLFLAESIVWPPAQIINFYFLPTQYRVLYDNTISLGFDYYYSYVKFKKDSTVGGSSSGKKSRSHCDISSEALDMLDSPSISPPISSENDDRESDMLRTFSRTCHSLQQSLHQYDRASRHVHIFDFEDVERFNSNE